jgi:hypothetical protein
MLVAITGVVQDPSTYSIVGTTLTFSAAPPSGTGNISVRYLGIPASGVTTTAYRTVTEFTATAGQTTFSVPSYTVGYIDVYRNGVMLGSADYTASNGTTVVLAAGATAGDLVETISFFVSSVLNALPQSGGSLSGNLSFAGTAGISGNLPFVGAGNRITGDFSNATIANRVLFQSSTTNGQTSVQAVPNGTNTFTSFDCLNSNDVANASLIYMGINGADDTRIVSTRRGTGAFLPMTFYTSGLERMRIDSSGRVTMPYQPAFLATGNGGSITIASGSYVPFNSLTSAVSTNRSSGYNTSTYLYTAPVAGLYQFSAQFYISTAAASFTWWKNGTQISYLDAAYATYMGTAQTLATSGNIILELAAGDTVGIQVRSGFASVGLYMGHSWFYGHLLG